MTVPMPGFGETAGPGAGQKGPGKEGGGTRQDREIFAARDALEGYGLRWSTSGLRGRRIVPLSTSRYKSLFRLVAPPRESLTLHLYRGHGGRNRKRISHNALASQALWMASLPAQAGLPVPEPVPAPDGSFVVQVSAPGERRPLRCLLLRWVPGRTKYGAVDASELRLVGGYLARMHNHAEWFTPPEWFERPRWTWRRGFGAQAALWERGEAFYPAAEMEVLREATGQAARDLMALGEGPDVFGMIHGDPHARNLIFCGGLLRRKTVCAIDFDRSGWGHYLYDLAAVLRPVGRHGKSSEAMRAALLESYQLDRPLPRDPDRPLAACALMRAVEMTNKALSWVDEPAGMRGDLRADLLRRTFNCAVRYLEEDPLAAFGG